MVDVAALILAAGASTRFGSPKQRATLGQRTLLETVIEIAAHELSPILVVVPPGLAVPPRAVPVPNPRPELGLAHSLRLGLAAVPPELEAAVILLGDQPTLPLGTLRRVLAARGEGSLVAAVADGVSGPPVLIERGAFGLAERLEGDIGLRDVIRSGGHRAHLVEIEAHAPDIDTPGDLESLGRSRIGHMFDSDQ